MSQMSSLVALAVRITFNKGKCHSVWLFDDCKCKLDSITFSGVLFVGLFDALKQTSVGVKILLELLETKQRLFKNLFRATSNFKECSLSRQSVFVFFFIRRRNFE